MNKPSRKRVSGLLAGGLIILVALIYVCSPGLTGMSAMITGSHASPCQNYSGDASLNNAMSMVNCLNAHLPAAGAIAQDFTTAAALLLLLVSAAIGYWLKRDILSSWFRSALTRGQYWYRRYRLAIKSLWERKLLRFLNLLGNYTAVALAV